MQSIEEDIDELSIIDDELLWAKPGTTADAMAPAARRAAINASCFFTVKGSGRTWTLSLRNARKALPWCISGPGRSTRRNGNLEPKLAVHLAARASGADSVALHITRSAFCQSGRHGGQSAPRSSSSLAGKRTKILRTKKIEENAFASPRLLSQKCHWSVTEELAGPSTCPAQANENGHERPTLGPHTRWRT